MTSDTLTTTTRLVTLAGDVDHGKSTLIGRLMAETGSLTREQWADIRSGGDKPAWNWAVDRFQEERDREATLDTARARIRTDRGRFDLIDAPGHEELIAQAMTGVTASGSALLVVDAAIGLGRQGRRHLGVSAMLGSCAVVVAINKIDALQHDRAAIRRTEDNVTEFLHAIGCHVVATVPVSANEGDNVAKISPNTPWYSGPTLLEALHQFPTENDRSDLPPRMPVQDRYSIDGKPLWVGRLESGALRAGDSVILLPGEDRATVQSIEQYGGSIAKAVAGDSVGIRLAPASPEKDPRGTVICAGERPQVSSTLACRLVWMGKEALSTGQSVAVACTTQEVPAKVVSITDVSDCGAPPGGGTEGALVKQWNSCRVTLQSEQPLVYDLHRDTPLNRLVVIDRGGVSGLGVWVQP